MAASLISHYLVENSPNKTETSIHIQIMPKTYKKTEKKYIYIYYVSKPVANYYYTPFVDGWMAHDELLYPPTHLFI
jgi:hypothetical protein